jgi:hypothetical protein
VPKPVTLQDKRKRQLALMKQVRPYLEKQATTLMGTLRNKTQPGGGT